MVALYSPLDLQAGRAMKKTAVNLGLIATALYLLLVGCWWFTGPAKSISTPADFGQFMGGVFGPVAFLWLILQVLASRAQTEAELSALAEQQQRMAKAARARFIVARGGSTSISGDRVDLIIELTNTGGEASLVTVEPINLPGTFSPREFPLILRTDHKQFQWSYNLASVDDKPKAIRIRYRDVNDTIWEQEFRFEPTDTSRHNWKVVAGEQRLAET